jgi:hypothetical protein
MIDFLGNVKKGSALDESTGVLTLSPIFQWFAGDFVAAAGSVLQFVLPFLPAATQTFLRANPGSVSLAYFTYDWDVNGVLSKFC